MKPILVLLTIIALVIILSIVLILSIGSTIIGVFVPDESMIEFDEYHHHPDNEI